MSSIFGSINKLNDWNMSNNSRTKKPGISRLELTPQINLDAVYRILLDEIADLESSLISIQKTFYGDGHDALDELTNWTQLLRPVMAVIKLTSLNSADQIEETIRRQLNNATLTADDLAAVQKLQESCRKTKDQVPGEGEPGSLEFILIGCKNMLKYLTKYCASFYSKDEDPCLETAGAYEGQRQRYINVINDKISHIYGLVEKFESNEGLQLKADFGPYTLDLARRAECSHVPYLLMFPEAIDNIRFALATMRTWLADDARYVEYLENDALDMQAKKENMVKEMRTAKKSYHQDIFRLKKDQMDCERLESELEKTQDREDQFTVEEEMLEMDTSDMSTELDTAEYRKRELAKMHLANPTNDVTLEQLNKVTEGIRDLKSKLPLAESRLGVIRNKLKMIENKKTELKEKRKNIKKLKSKTNEMMQLLEEAEIELAATAHALRTVQKIILYKQSADVVQKMFYELPVQSNSSRLPGTKDSFDKTCYLVAQRIESDWPALYRVLPFYPPRGRTTIDKDISELALMESRIGKNETAGKAIDRWRRFHTRAKVDDLLIALSMIKRQEIMTQIKLETSPPSRDVIVQSEVPEWLSPDLVPYWREVEKFDQLKASNRFQ